MTEENRILQEDFQLQQEEYKRLTDALAVAAQVQAALAQAVEAERLQKLQEGQ